MDGRACQPFASPVTDSGHTERDTLLGTAYIAPRGLLTPHTGTEAMANTLITPPELDETARTSETRRRGFTTGPAAPDYGAVPNLGEPEALAGPVNPFQSLIQNFRDAFFPEKLPPLELQSKPIAVKDPMAVQRDPMSTAVAVGIHALVLLLVIWISAKAIKTYVAAPKAEPKIVTFNEPPPPPPVLKAPVQQSSGGGGGQRDIAPVSKGSPPKFSMQPQIVPPSAPPKIQPKLAVEPTVMADPRNQMKSNLPNIGLPNGVNVGVVSMGSGSGTGLGSGSGAGVGPGNGMGIGGGDYRAGVNGVSIPQVIYQVDADFSEEARKAKFQGEVIVSLVVDASGHPQRVRVPRPIGMGLDEKAVEAVRQYRFKPATKNGQAVPVLMNIAVNFQIF